MSELVSLKNKKTIEQKKKAKKMKSEENKVKLVSELISGAMSSGG